MRKLVAALLVALTLGVSAACAVPGLDREPTALEQLAGIEASMTAARTDVLVALDAGSITPDQAEEATFGLDRADEALTVARSIMAAGVETPDEAAEMVRNLNIARAVLTTLGAVLQKDYVPSEGLPE